MLEPSRQLGPKSPSQDPPAAPGQWRVCPGPQGSTSGEGRSFGGPAGLPTALVWPDPLATPRVTVWPQPPDLLGPREAPAGPGNPIPLGALRGGCLGPQGQVRGQPSRSPGSPAAPPTSAPSLRWGWVPARSPSLSRSLLSTYWMPRLQPRAAQAGLGGGHMEPRRADLGAGVWAGLPWQRWRGSYYQPPAARGSHWETPRGRVAWTTCGALRGDTEKGTQGGRTRSRDPGPAARRPESSSPMPGPGDGCWASSVSPGEAVEPARWRREPGTS